MNKLRIYCDTGAYRPELRELEVQGRVELVQFRYENRNRRVRQVAVPSAPSWKQMNYTWDEMRTLTGFESITWDGLGRHSPKFDGLVDILGRDCSVDAQHLDSAHASECCVFLTSDKGDICDKAAEIRALTGIEVLHFRDDWERLLLLLPPRPASEATTSAD